MTSNPFLHCLLAVILLLSAGCGDSPERSRELATLSLERSQTYMDIGQYRAATIEARNAVLNDPTMTAGYVSQAKILNLLGLYKEAVAALQAIPDDNQLDDDYAVELANAFVGRGKFKSALVALAESTTTSADIARAEAHTGLQNYDLAGEIYSRILESEPTHLEASIGLARLNLLAGLEGRDRALQLVGTLDQHYSDNAQIALLKAQIAVASEDMDAAENHLTDAVAALPNSDTITLEKAYTIRLLAEVLTRSGKTSEALVYTRMLADAFPGADLARADYEKATELYKAGELEQARDILFQLTRDYPSHEEANIFLGVILYQTGDAQTASNYFANNVDAETHSEEITEIVALTSLRNQKPQQVLDLLDGRLEEIQSTKLLNLYGISALTLDEVDIGLSALEKSIEKNPAQPTIYIALARYFNNTSPVNRNRAAHYLQHGLLANNDSFELQNAAVEQDVLMNRIEAAQQRVDKILERKADSHRAHQVAANFYQRRGNLERVQNHLQRAVSLAADDLSANLDYAIHLLNTRAYSKALEHFESALTIDANSALAYRGLLAASDGDGNVDASFERVLSLGDIPAALSAAGEYAIDTDRHPLAERAIQALAILEDSNDEATRLKLKLGSRQVRQYLAARDWAAARETALGALALSPGSSYFLGVLIEAEVGSENFNEVRKLIPQLRRQSPRLASVLDGELAIAENKPDMAMQIFRQLWGKEPSDSVALRLSQLIQQQRPAELPAFLAEWQSRLPESLVVLSQISTAHLAKGNYEKAIPALEVLATKAPGNPVNLNNLAWSYFETGDERALETARKAVAIAPSNASILDTYGWLLYRSGNIAEAEKALSEAHRLEPGNTAIKQHLDQARQ